MNGKSELSGVRHLGALQEQSMNDVLKQAAEALRQAQAFIDGMRSDLHRLRATDWFPEGAHDAASSMSENMRLLGNACADFDCIGAGLAALESAQEPRTVEPLTDADRNALFAEVNALMPGLDSPEEMFSTIVRFVQRAFAAKNGLVLAGGEG